MQSLQTELYNKIRANSERWVEAAVALQYDKQPDLKKRYQSRHRQLHVEDTRYHFTYLTEAVNVESQALFLSYIQWVDDLLLSRNVPRRDFIGNLECMAEVVRGGIAAQEWAVVQDYFTVALNELERREATNEIIAEETHPHSELTEQYMEALLRGDRGKAGQLIFQAIDEGARIQDIYIDVFQSAQHKVGRLWQQNKISVAQEHFCTAATQLIMAQLYPRFLLATESDKRFLALTVSDELHEIGIRMVADLMEMNGWNTHYLGANMPDTGVLSAIESHRPDVLGISATMTFHIGRVIHLIEAVRSHFGKDSPKILVGGYPFVIEHDLWKKVGADGYAPDGVAAVSLAEEILKKG